MSLCQFIGHAMDVAKCTQVQVNLALTNSQNAHQPDKKYKAKQRKRTNKK